MEILLRNKFVRQSKMLVFCYMKCFPANIYLFTVNKGNTGKRCKIFKVNNKNTKTTSIMSYLASFSSASIVDFEHVNVSWVILKKSVSCPYEKSEPVQV